MQTRFAPETSVDTAEHVALRYPLDAVRVVNERANAPRQQVAHNLKQRVVAYVPATLDRRKVSGARSERQAEYLQDLAAVSPYTYPNHDDHDSNDHI